jgi:tetratricopeptide (TPR) repeat protein
MACENLGESLLRTGDFDGAMACFERTTDLPKDPAQKWFDLGNGFFNGGHLTDAIACYQQASQLAGGGNPMMLGALAAAYAEAGRYDTATLTARKALDQAQAQKNDNLAAALQEQIKLYEKSLPLRDTK